MRLCFLLLLLLLWGCEDHQESGVVIVDDVSFRYAGKDEEWMISKFGPPDYGETTCYPGELSFAFTPVYRLKPKEEGKICYYDTPDGGQQVLFLVRSEDRPWLVVSDIYVPPGTKY